MNSSKVHSIGCDLSDQETKSILNKITSLGSIVLPVVCLPDLHLKKRTEGPCSFVAVTEGTIVPELTAPSVGCGMGLIATSLKNNDLNIDSIKNFYAEMKKELGPRYGRLKNILLWLGFINRPTKKYDLSVDEFENIIKHGALAAIKKYNLPNHFINSVENNGSTFNKEELESLNLKNILPRISYRSGRHDIGYGFKGNHFLEIQYVEEILDEKEAEKLGIKKNQVVIMYHGGGGAVSYHIGRYFGNRKKNTLSQKMVLFFFKSMFHFWPPSEWKYIFKRIRYYFFPKPFMEIPLSDREGIRALQATKASLNYSYGFRMAIVRRIMDSLRYVFGAEVSANLIWDSIHNSISEEKINGKEVIVHRHTANRVFEGLPIIVSGFNTTSSYLAIGLKNNDKNLYSSDHGAGITIKKHEKGKISTTHPNKFKTTIFQTREPQIQTREHITDEGIDYVVSHLEKERIINRVARLRPIAVFKG